MHQTLRRHVFLANWTMTPLKQVVVPFNTPIAHSWMLDKWMPVPLSAALLAAALPTQDPSPILDQ